MRHTGIETAYVMDKSLTSVRASFMIVDHSVSSLNVCFRPLILLLFLDVLFATLLDGIAVGSRKPTHGSPDANNLPLCTLALPSLTCYLLLPASSPRLKSG